MGKRHDWSVTTYVFLFLSLASQIYCTSETHLSRSMLGAGSSKEKDLITKLPGQPSDVSFRQYGGYVAVDEKARRFLYYYFVEAIKPSNSTPLVLWINGGPGCSSLGSAAFRGIGPFRIQADGKTLSPNPYSWNNEANVLFYDSPAGAGFSHSETESAEKIGKQGDTLSAKDNYIFLVNWLERFPEYKGREIYFIGHSYAGHFGPQLAQIILRRNNQTFINLRGMMLGNAALKINGMDAHIRQYLVNHGVFSQEHVDALENCNSETDNGAIELEKCFEVETILLTEYKKLDTSNIYAPRCINSTSTRKPKKCTTIMDVDPCSSNYSKHYLNMKKVQEAMHAIANTTKLPYRWDVCSPGLDKKWNNDHKLTSMIPILRELMGKGLRMMIYNGDMDAVVPFTATMSDLKDLNLTVVNEWRSWFTEGQVGGYTVDYKGNLTYATVRGAGHSVTRDQPMRALTLFTSFIRSTPLPKTP